MQKFKIRYSRGMHSPPNIAMDQATADALTVNTDLMTIAHDVSDGTVFLTPNKQGKARITHNSGHAKLPYRITVPVAYQKTFPRSGTVDIEAEWDDGTLAFILPDVLPAARQTIRTHYTYKTLSPAVKGVAPSEDETPVPLPDPDPIQAALAARDALIKALGDITGAGMKALTTSGDLVEIKPSSVKLLLPEPVTVMKFVEK